MDPKPIHECKSCPKRMPYQSSYDKAMAGLEAARLPHVMCPPLIAIALKETQAQSFWTVKDTLYKANMHDFLENTNFTAQDFFKEINAEGAGTGGLIPAFRYEPSWQIKAESLRAKWPMTVLQTRLLACSWGVGQKGGWIYCVDAIAKDAMPKLKEFIWSESLQWRQLAFDWHDAYNEADGHVALAATKYNAGVGAHLVNSYGRMVESMSRTVEIMLTREGKPLCLDGVKSLQKLI
jgi:hypothetical protein